jgi:hypothetical protein
MSWAPDHDLLFATFDDNTFDFSEKMRISTDGRIIAPALSPSIIDAGGDRSLVTKEYVDDALATNSVTKTITFPAAAFQPSGYNAEFFNNGEYAYMNFGTARLNAPITLPVGTFISEIKIYVHDEAETLGLGAHFASAADFEPFTLTGFQVTSGATGSQIFTIAVNTEVLAGHQYVAQVYPAGGSGAFDSWSGHALRLYKMELTYTE